MNGETICVVGSSGFVGSHVAATLLARGYDVHATLRNAGGPNAGWLMSDVASAGEGGAQLTLFTADVYDPDSLKRAMSGCSGVIVCAGSPVIEPETIDLMVAVGENCCDAALETEIARIVITSSTGSTNPPEGEPELKDEIDHWSDADLQLTQKKFAAVGKTRLDRIVLGRMQASGGALRVCTINPSMITGPAYQPEPVVGHQRFAAIIKDERFADSIPNSSMSMVDARDLAALHVAALERDDANGRYFGVRQSWHWREILQALQRVWPAYRMPPIDPDEVAVRPTQFDLTRQNSLGVTLRGLDEMLEAHVQELVRRAMI